MIEIETLISYFASNEVRCKSVTDSVCCAALVSAIEGKISDIGPSRFNVGLLGMIQAHREGVLT